jgi:hypothetical protein
VKISRILCQGYRKTADRQLTPLSEPNLQPGITIRALTSTKASYAGLWHTLQALPHRYLPEKTKGVVVSRPPFLGQTLSQVEKQILKQILKRILKQILKRILRQIRRQRFSFCYPLWFLRANAHKWSVFSHLSSKRWFNVDHTFRFFRANAHKWEILNHPSRLRW